MAMWVKLYVLFSFLANFQGFAVSQSFKDLGGNWNVQNLEHELNFPAIVPGGIYSDLMRNNIIENVFYQFNDVKTRWVSKTSWNYSKLFSVDADFLQNENINLVFDGIDTFSTILLNDIVLGSTENMFVRYSFEVKSHLQLNNKIEIRFESPVKKAEQLFKEQSQRYVVPPVCIPSILNGECHANHVRKMQSSFAWDWGPGLPSVGIWKKLYLEGFNSTVIKDITVNILPNDVNNHWDIQIKTFYANSFQNIIFGTITIELQTHITTVIIIDRVILNITEDTFSTHNVSIPQPYVKLWWPNGYGDANLYNLKITFLNSQKTESSSKTVKIGFRTIDLIQNSIEQGRTFYFKINGVPIFAKGANSIPVNILPELGQNKSTVRFLLQSAKDVNMNMLRVWGGGVYESDFYYELADQLGLLIWQDFMFACSMYPTNNEFLETVQKEVRHQVRRLQYHPSIIIWSGNNENEAALRENWYNTKSNFTLYKEDYKTLYVKTIKSEVLLNDPTRPYLTSSPTNGVESVQEDYVAQNPQSNFYGDVHFYNYLVDGWKTTAYPISRFASEFGYQSMPSFETWLTATNSTSDLTYGSLFLFHRQHHPMGYAEIVLLIQYQLRLPNADNSNFSKAFIFYSQILQAMAVKIEVEYYRQWRSNVNDAGEGITMGALYWQLNDVWVAPTWSSIDFSGRWKMLHYFAKHFFAPIIVTGNLTINNELAIFVISDKLTIIQNAKLNVSIYTWDSFVPLHQHSLTVDIIPGVSHNVISDYIQNIFDLSNHTTRDYFIYLTLRDVGNNFMAYDNFLLPTALKSANLKIPVIQISSIIPGKRENEFQVEIVTNEISLFVWLDSHAIIGRFSENGFLQVSPTKSVNFVSEEVVTVDILKKSLTVTNLMDRQYL